MTTHAHSLLKGLGRGVLLLSFVLLPSLTTGSGIFTITQGNPFRRSASPNDAPRPQARAVPYLHVIGPPALRFREPPAPPAYELEPVVAGPTFIEAAQPLPVAPLPKEKEPSTVVAIPAKPAVTPAHEKTPEEPDSVPILPDDTRRDVRPEDLLPFFQFPKNGGTTIGVRVPVPAQPPAPALPPSSATYRQQ